MSPILVRPVREQLEHDRVIRLLQSRYRRRFTVEVNLGSEETAAGRHRDRGAVSRPRADVTEVARKLLGVVEVETGESVNQLEALAQWARYGRLPVEFALYVPVAAAGAARRLCADHRIGVTEIWTYHTLGDQVRFAQIDRAPVAGKLAAARAAAAAARRASSKASRPAAGPRQTSKKPAGSGRTSWRAWSRWKRTSRSTSSRRWRSGRGSGSCPWSSSFTCRLPPWAWPGGCAADHASASRRFAPITRVGDQVRFAQVHRAAARREAGRGQGGCGRGQAGSGAGSRGRESRRGESAVRREAGFGEARRTGRRSARLRSRHDRR